MMAECITVPLGGQSLNPWDTGTAGKDQHHYIDIRTEDQTLETNTLSAVLKYQNPFRPFFNLFNFFFTFQLKHSLNTQFEATIANAEKILILNPRVRFP